LTKDSDPKEEEMKQMSEFVTKLEGYADLEVSIIRQTKINKVLKAILKLNNIPKEEEFQFKPRSTALLDKWNKLLASEQGTPVTATGTNGIKSEAKASTEETKASPAEPTNGVKEVIEEAKVEEKVEPKSEEPAAPVEPVASEVKEAVVPPVEEPVKVCNMQSLARFIRTETNQSTGSNRRTGPSRVNRLMVQCLDFETGQWQLTDN
jgi:hypothetical protein